MYFGIRYQRSLARYVSLCGDVKMHYRKGAIANGEPLAGARRLGGELTPEQDRECEGREYTLGLGVLSNFLPQFQLQS